MAIRTSTESVTLAAPLKLRGRDETLPPGTYTVETDEEAIEGNGRTIYRRVATLLIVEGGGTRRTITVDPADLAAAREAKA